MDSIKKLINAIKITDEINQARGYGKNKINVLEILKGNYDTITSDLNQRKNIENIDLEKLNNDVKITIINSAKNSLCIGKNEYDNSINVLIISLAIELYPFNKAYNNEDLINIFNESIYKQIVNNEKYNIKIIQSLIRGLDCVVVDLDTSQINKILYILDELILAHKKKELTK